MRHRPGTTYGSVPQRTALYCCLGSRLRTLVAATGKRSTLDGQGTCAGEPPALVAVADVATATRVPELEFLSDSTLSRVPAR